MTPQDIKPLHLLKNGTPIGDYTPLDGSSIDVPSSVAYVSEQTENLYGQIVQLLIADIMPVLMRSDTDPNVQGVTRDHYYYPTARTGVDSDYSFIGYDGSRTEIATVHTDNSVTYSVKPNGVHRLMEVYQTESDPAPYGFWIVDLEKPNPDAPSGYDWAYAHDLIEGIRKGEVFVLYPYQSFVTYMDSPVLHMTRIEDQSGVDSLGNHFEAVRIFFDTCTYRGSPASYAMTSIYTPDMNDTSTHTGRMAVLDWRGVDRPFMSFDLADASAVEYESNKVQSLDNDSSHYPSCTAVKSYVAGAMPAASTATPAMDGVASAGSSTSWARGDHVHPTDSSREAVANKSQTLDPTSTTDYPSSAAAANFVNSSVATNTANFLGSFTLSNLGLTYPATNVQIASALNNHVWPAGVTPTNNDYVYVEIQNPQTTGVDDKVERFKFSSLLASWGYEYTLNNSSFTAAEVAAIDSGIDSSKVATYDAAVGTLASHVADTSNPHNVTKLQVGLGNVDNTSDADKPISTAQQTALNAKQDTVSTDTDSSAFGDNTTIATGFSSNKLHLNLASRLWTYIQNKISSVLGLTASSYGGNAATATNAEPRSFFIRGYIITEPRRWAKVATSNLPMSNFFTHLLNCHISYIGYLNRASSVGHLEVVYSAVGGNAVYKLNLYDDAGADISKFDAKIVRTSTNVEVWCKIENGDTGCCVTCINIHRFVMNYADSGIFSKQLTDEEFSAYCEGNEVYGLTKYLLSKTGTPGAGSVSTPVYVDSSGNVQECTPSQMSVGSATTATNYASDGGIANAINSKLDKTGDASNTTSTLTKNSGDTSDMTSGGKLSAIFTAISNAFATFYNHVSNTTNPHNVTKSQVGLSSVVNSGDSATPVEGGTTKFTTGGAYTELAKKVDKESGKGLSSNDFTNAYKSDIDNNSAARHTHSAGTGLKSSLTSGVVTTSTNVERLSSSANISLPENSFSIVEMTDVSTNLPQSGYCHILTSQGFDPTYTVQLALGMTYDGVFIRKKYAGVWDGWVRLMDMIEHGRRVVFWNDASCYAGGNANRYFRLATISSEALQNNINNVWRAIVSTDSVIEVAYLRLKVRLNSAGSQPVGNLNVSPIGTWSGAVSFVLVLRGVVGNVAVDIWAHHEGGYRSTVISDMGGGSFNLTSPYKNNWTYTSYNNDGSSSIPTDADTQIINAVVD